MSVLLGLLFVLCQNSLLIDYFLFYDITSVTIGQVAGLFLYKFHQLTV